jgi:hypothetical protein
MISMISKFNKLIGMLILGIALVAGSGASAHAGAVDGAKSGFYRLNAGYYNTFRISFWAGELAEVGVIGDGATNVDLYIYDSYGNLVAWDENHTDKCYVKWVPRYTETFTIKLVNRGGVYNDYRLMTN